MTKVKICGITNLEDALHAVGCGADALGFNFYEKSPRYILPEDARKIVKKLNDDVFKVGVFVNESQEHILKVANIAALDTIQLHGDENFEFVTKLHRATDKELIKAIRVTPDLDRTVLMDFDAHAILFDANSRGEYGGSGQCFDWEIAKDAVNMIPHLYLAGGLDPENVAEAIRTVRPYAVDVASGVESSLGKKDPNKVAAFIKAAREAI